MVLRLNCRLGQSKRNTYQKERCASTYAVCVLRCLVNLSGQHNFTSTKDEHGADDVKNL